MIKVRILKSGEIKEVTRNEAHGLIENKEAEVVKEDTQEPQPYMHRQMKPVSKTTKRK